MSSDPGGRRVGSGKMALVYAREPQYNERERTSVDDQLIACRALAHSLGYEVSGEVHLIDRDPNSAMSRPGMNTLISLVASGKIGAIVTYSLDRLGKPESEGLEALLRELRRRQIPVYLARTPKGYSYDPTTGRLIHDDEEVHRANMEGWRAPEFIVIPRESEQDDLLADRYTMSKSKRNRRGDKQDD
jgi:hypothetical protein